MLDLQGTGIGVVRHAGHRQALYREEGAGWIFRVDEWRISWYSSIVGEGAVEMGDQ